MHTDSNAGFRYKIVKQLGDGTYGSVWKGMNLQTNEVVSIASMRPAQAQIPSN